MYLNKNLLNYEELCNKNNASFIESYFINDVYDWKIEQVRTLYSYNFLSPLYESSVQLTASYKEKTAEGEITRYIVFERRLSENLSFHSWRIFILDYNENI